MPLERFVAQPPSRRARVAVSVTRRTVRPLTPLIPNTALGVRLTRGLAAATLAGASPVPRWTTVTPVDLRYAGGRVVGEWVRAHPRDGAAGRDGTAGRDERDGAGATARADRTGALLYLHGSGYAICSPRTHRGLAANLSALTGLAVFVLDYRLAPRHRFPAAADDVKRAYDWLLDGQLEPAQLAVAGDSAGGHLAVDLSLSQLRSAGPVPAALALFSPLLDCSLALAETRDRVHPDPMISAAGARELVAHYLRGVDPDHPRLRLRPAPGEVLPPTLIQAGGEEMFCADARELHRLITAAGGRSELEVWPGQAHVFQAMTRTIPEARRALRRAAQFLVDALDQARQADRPQAAVTAPTRTTRRVPRNATALLGCPATAAAAPGRWSPAPAAASARRSRSSWRRAAAAWCAAISTRTRRSGPRTRSPTPPRRAAGALSPPPVTSPAPRRWRRWRPRRPAGSAPRPPW